MECVMLVMFGDSSVRSCNVMLCLVPAWHGNVMQCFVIPCVAVYCNVMLWYVMVCFVWFSVVRFQLVLLCYFM